MFRLNWPNGFKPEDKNIYKCMTVDKRPLNIQSYRDITNHKGQSHFSH
jgi:hypothetical protein